MTTTFTEAKTLLSSILDDDGTTTSANLGLFLNLAHSDVARARDWPELTTTGFVNLAAPYSTGTVSLSENGSALTGSGTTWNSQTPALDKGFKFALSYQTPWYGITSIDSDTGITLDSNYIATTLSGSTYVLYRDTVSMPAACNKIYEVWLHDDTGSYELEYIVNPWMGAWKRYPLQADAPTQYTVLEKDSTGAMQIQVGPFAPDKAYRLQIVYRMSVDEDKLAGDSASNTLDDDRLDVILQKALYWAFRRDRARAANQLTIYKSMLEAEWEGADEQGSEIIRLQQQVPETYVRRGENYADLEQ